MQENGGGIFLFVLTTCSFVVFNTASGYLKPHNFLAPRLQAEHNNQMLLCVDLFPAYVVELFPAVDLFPAYVVEGLKYPYVSVNK